MSINILQTPASASLAQSPIVFTVEETNTGSFASSSFQYVGELTYWTGSNEDSGSNSDFTFVKFPNQSFSGIFDVSRVMNSLFQEDLEILPSQIYKIKMKFYHQFLSSSLNVTSSVVETGIYKVIDGYSLFGEDITGSLSDKSSFWPIMTDGPSVQTTFEGNKGRMGLWSTSGAGDVPTKVVYSGSNGQIEELSVSSSENTTGSITQFPIGTAETDFPVSSSVEWYDVLPYSGSTPLASNLRFNIECEKKYPNVRVKWKNRYGQFDYFNFSLASQESFSTDVQTYERQVGTWQGKTLDYRKSSSNIKNYIADTEQTITVNTDYISEDYNDIFKQLLLSEEIYWLYDEGNDLVRPLTIDTDTLTFRSGVRDKLIQYEFDFIYGQTYKLIL